MGDAGAALERLVILAPAFGLEELVLGYMGAAAPAAYARPVPAQSADPAGEEL